MLTDQDIFYEYEQVLLGKRKNYASELFAGLSPSRKEELALRFFRLIFEKYFNWTPEEAYHNLNATILERMKLSSLVKYIQFPPEFSPTEDCFYIVAKAYPEKFTISETKQTEIMYKRVLSGEVSRFPRFFFEGRDGRMRALFCLQYAINEFSACETAEELYRQFAYHGTEFIKKYRLWEAYKMNFNSYPIDYLNECMSIYSKYEYSFLYAKYRTLAEYRELVKNTSKKTKRVASSKAEGTAQENGEVVENG